MKKTEIFEKKNWKYRIRFNKKNLVDGFNNTREGALVLSLPTLEKCVNDPSLESLSFRIFMTRRERNKQLKERRIEIDNKLNELKQSREQDLER